MVFLVDTLRLFSINLFHDIFFTFFLFVLFSVAIFFWPKICILPFEDLQNLQPQNSPFFALLLHFYVTIFLESQNSFSNFFQNFFKTFCFLVEEKNLKLFFEKICQIISKLTKNLSFFVKFLE